MTLQNDSRSAREITAPVDAWEIVDDVPDAAMALPETKLVTDWRSVCGRGVLCACSTAGAAGLSHIGCLLAPTLAFAGVVGSASISTVSVGASLALTAAGAGLWYKLRGAVATRLEKTLTMGGMVSGAALTLIIHFGGAAGGHDHHHDMEEALEWYRSRPAEVQLEIQQAAAAQKRPLQEVIFDICGTELTARPSEKSTAPGLDNL